jgi:hypothetical protein
MFKQFGYDHLLCPCVRIGDLHLMEKASQNFPPGMYEVAIFSPKIKNWGMIDNKIKRLDYSWDTFSENNNWYVRFLKSDVEKYTVKFDWFSTFVFDRGEEWHCYIQYNERCFDFMYKNVKSTLVMHG